MQVILKLGKEFIIMNENNNMNNNYTNNPAPEQPAGRQHVSGNNISAAGSEYISAGACAGRRQHVPL